MKEELELLKIKGEDQVSYPEDVERIKEIILKKGYIATNRQAESLWDSHSDSMAAGWLGLDSYSDEEIWQAIYNYIDF